MRRVTLILACAGILIFALANQTNAAAPQLINYQGVLADSSGEGLDTTVSMVFTIYDDPSAGSTIWTETQSSVTVVNGLFNVLLGSVTELVDTVFNDTTRYLGIKVGTDPEISPRIRLVSVPYAYHSEHSDNALHADTADFADTAGLAVLALVAELAIFADSARVADSLDSFSSEDFSLTGHTHGGGGSGWTDIGTVVRLDASTDSVGIGTSAPSEKLDVVGNFVVSGKATIGPNTINTGLNAFSAGENNEVIGDHSVVGGGRLNSARGDYSVIAGGGGATFNDSNFALGNKSSIGGGDGNIAGGPRSVIGGGSDNRSMGDANTVSGGVLNEADSSFTTISGGTQNRALKNFATIGGGFSNEAIGIFSTIAGGADNHADSAASTIGGGQQNFAIGDGATVGGGEGNVSSGDGSTVSGGATNSAESARSTVGGGQNNHATNLDVTISGGVNNIASNQGATIAGGTSNNASGFQATIGGGAGNEASVGSYPLVAGGQGNTSNAHFAVVSGGHFNAAAANGAVVSGGGNNSARGEYSVVGGGGGLTPADSNLAGGFISVVGGGSKNYATGDSSTIAGGVLNTANGTAATIGGGQINTASGNWSFVGGGAGNVASGLRSTVPGGNSNQANGDYSFAAGDQARANHTSAFVWADNSGAAFSSTAIQQFLIRSAGGVGINTNAPFTDLTLDGSIGFKNNTDPMMYIYQSGTLNPEKPIAVHSPTFTNYGLFYNDATDYFVFKGFVASALTVNVATGKVGIGSLSPSQALHVVGNICATGSIGACSDIRYKTNVTPLSGAAELVSRLRGVNFDWKTEEFPENDFSDEPQIGFIAQEVLEVLPQVVDQGSDGYYQVDYSRLTPLLVEAFKEQQQTIKDLQVQLVELQEQLKLLASAQKKANSANYEYGLK